MENILIKNHSAYISQTVLHSTYSKIRKGIRYTRKLTGSLVMLCFLVMMSHQSTSAETFSENVMDTGYSSELAENNTSGYSSASAVRFSLPAPRFVPSNISGSRYSLSAEESAQDEDEVTVGLQGGKYGIGFAASFPAYGVSGTYQMSDKITAEAILGFFGVISNYGVRGWYRFNRNLKYDIYAYGGLSVLQYRYRTFSNNRWDRETVPGVGIGAGLEWGMQKVFEDDSLPPLFFNLEFGLVLANFEHYNLSSMVFGSGIHYRFGN